MRIANTTHPDGAMTVVHKDGCADVARERRYGYVDVFDADSREEVALDIFGDQIDEGSMTLEEALAEVTWKPCVADLPERR